MCGIFGVSIKNQEKYSQKQAKEIAEILFKLSESRGKEASGLALKNPESIDILKLPLSASSFIKSEDYRKFSEKIAGAKTGPLTIIGHSRLATHGTEYSDYNNQPVVKKNTLCVHNGIIANDKEIWQKFPEIKREFEVDTEVLLALLEMFTPRTSSLISAVQKTLKAIEGSASVAILFNNNPYLVLTTNTGSLYTYSDKEIFLFGSERYILEKFIKKAKNIDYFDQKLIKHIPAQKGTIINLNNLEIIDFSLSEEQAIPLLKQTHLEIKFIDHSKKEKQNLFSTDPIGTNNFRLSAETKKSMNQAWKNIYLNNNLKRCAECLYPETMPFINFDEYGICNYCRNHKKIEIKGEKELEKIAAKYRRIDRKPDCIVPFSGGRDSVYGLHYIKNVLKMNPIAYTYDWGVLTDLGRRNQARVCGKLGVEHIIISADIRKKRANIRKNINAWLKKPDLGMIPIFMAGDKQLLYYSDQLKKKTKIDLLIYSCGNELEDEPFKTGFANVSLANLSSHRIPVIPKFHKLKLAQYYLKQYLLNPSYINGSLLDSIFAFWSLLILPENEVHLFEYLKWNENKILKTIIDEYNWELEKDTKASWRIDDGTAPFYNYIYMTAAGFTEFDTFRSAQIRENQIDRETAFEMLKEENKPRFDSIEWYAKIIGFDPNYVIEKINSIPKLYKI